MVSPIGDMGEVGANPLICNGKLQGGWGVGVRDAAFRTNPILS